VLRYGSLWLNVLHPSWEQDKTLKKAKKTPEDHHMLWIQERRPQNPSLSKLSSWTTLLRQNWSDQSSSSLVSQVKVKTTSKGPIVSRTRQGLQEASQRQEKKHMSKIRGRICYSCRLKGHLSQDCPNGNKHELKVVNSAPHMHGNSNGLSMILERWLVHQVLEPFECLNPYWLTSKDPMRLGYQNLPKTSCRWLEKHWELDFNIKI
jgi:hypothetical protein